MSAIEKSAEAIEAIQKLNQKLEEYKHPLLPSPGIAITMLKGYEKDNVVPVSYTHLDVYKRQGFSCR